jgi:hypothetical protein
MSRKISLVPDRPAIGSSFDSYIHTLMCPHWSLAEVLDFSEGQNASVKYLLDVVNNDLEAKLRMLAEAVTAAYGEQSLTLTGSGMEVRTMERKGAANG